MEIVSHKIFPAVFKDKYQIDMLKADVKLDKSMF